MNTAVRYRRFVRHLKPIVWHALERLSLVEGEPPNPSMASWVDAKGDETLRLDYDLSADSVVLDVGGHEGEWSHSIWKRYQSRVWVFEPMPGSIRALTRRFGSMSGVTVLPFGLGADTKDAVCAELGDSSSLYRSSGRQVVVQIRDVVEVMRDLALTRIDLVKINIEGGEYDLIERLIDSGWIARCRDVQVQFHRCVPDAENRRETIRSRLSASHVVTYDYPFVWENWRRKPGGLDSAAI
jgi:FkbM family methyltransferase